MRTDAFSIKHHQRMTLTMQLLTTDLTQIHLHIDKLKRQGPTFFKGAMVLLDCHKLSEIPHDFFKTLLKTCRQHDFTILGILADPHGHHTEALTQGLPTIEAKEGPALTPKNTQSMIIHGPVRSGQQIVQEHGDLIVIGAISAGAELLADGNIHVYGPLRGKALAGIHGLKSAQIFCLQLEAELVAISGVHHMTSSMPSPHLGTHPVSIQLTDQGLNYQALLSKTPVYS